MDAVRLLHSPRVVFDTARACLAVQTHLARIATHRPLEHISDPDERAAAEHLRKWFAKEFLDASVD